MPEWHLREVRVIHSRRGLDPPEGEQILDKGTRGGDVGLEALEEDPQNVEEELLLRPEASASLAGGHIVHAIHELDLPEYVLVFRRNSSSTGINVRACEATAFMSVVLPRSMAVGW